MRVSPLDIRKQEFTKAFRGYEIEEVNAFLQMLAREWEEVRDDNRRLEEQIRGLEDKIKHYERVEEALQEALQTARDSTRKAVNNAEERARLIVRDAEARASEITRDAETRLERMESETTRLGNRQHEIIARLRAFLQAETDMLERFEKSQLDESEEQSARKPARQVPSPTLTAQKSSAPPPAAKKFAPPVEEDFDDEGDEAVFNPAAIEEPEETRPVKAGTFNVRSLVAGARAIEEDDDEPEAHAARRFDEVEDEDDEADARHGRQAAEEIDKIRRILNDLD